MSEKQIIVLLFLFEFFVVIVKSQEDPKLLSLSCQLNSETCSECLNHHSSCSWCFDLEYNNIRCDLKAKLQQQNCISIYSGKTSNLLIKQNLEFLDVTDNVKNAVQIRPQLVQLKLRPGDSKKINLKYKIAKNYPLDLYYLMDATYTMKDDLETVATLGDHLTQALANLTSNFRIGFGIFSDKVVMPFFRMDEESLKNPCVGTEIGTCGPGFGFKHKFMLDNDVKGFIRQVNTTELTANLDNAEGALDALMQVLVCGPKIGWINDSRKIIFLLTNGLLHFAGDGKLAAIPTKSDGLCHLDDHGYYTESTLQDYPSLEEIYRKLKKHKTNVIFAVTDEVYDYYVKLNESIPYYTNVTYLDSDSSNILNVIKDGYENVVSVVEFEDNAKKSIEVSYYSNCNKNSKFNKTNFCNNVKEGEVYNFEVNIRLDYCPEDPKLWKQQIIIDETHLETESLVIDLEMLCGCNCEDNQKNSSICNYHGNIECGICKCDEGWSGDNCDCDYSNFENDRMLENNCREFSGNTTSVMCHGNGECICGKCECNFLYSGKYCGCRKCDRINNQECGGPKRGLCSCGTCLCMPGYTGPNCLCSLDKETCKAPGDTEECSGHGTCNCGKCKCNSEPFVFSGTYCEKCTTCAGLCNLYENCAKCSIQNNCQKDECNSEIVSSVEFVDYIEDLSNPCITKVDKLHCPFWKYAYELNKNNTVRLIILNESCTPPVSAEIYAVGAFLLVALIGILIIVIYIMRIRRKNKEEVERFLKEVENSKNEFSNSSVTSPLYKSPKTTFVVPECAHFE